MTGLTLAFDAIRAVVKLQNFSPGHNLRNLIQVTMELDTSLFEWHWKQFFDAFGELQADVLTCRSWVAQRLQVLLFLSWLACYFCLSQLFICKSHKWELPCWNVKFFKRVVILYGFSIPLHSRAALWKDTVVLWWLVLTPTPLCCMSLNSAIPDQNGRTDLLLGVSSLSLQHLALPILDHQFWSEHLLRTTSTITDIHQALCILEGSPSILSGWQAQ